MFDANAAHIKCGEKFFAEVHATDEQLKSMGINCGDIILCEHVDKGESPRENAKSMVFTSKGCKGREWLFDERSEDWSWMVYSGRPSGGGFIDDKWKSKALEFMGGCWEA